MGLVLGDLGKVHVAPSDAAKIQPFLGLGGMFGDPMVHLGTWAHAVLAQFDKAMATIPWSTTPTIPWRNLKMKSECSLSVIVNFVPCKKTAATYKMCADYEREFVRLWLAQIRLSLIVCVCRYYLSLYQRW